MLKTFYKKIKGVYEEAIGTATVVSPEVVVNKNWNPNSEYSGEAMKVPSKNFYDYLGPYITPDEGLKTGTFTDETGNEVKGMGLGRHPYNNDLGRALDRKIFSSPAPMGLSIDYSDEPEYDIFVQESLSRSTGQSYTISSGTKRYYSGSVKKNEVNYSWKGTWGDTENGFQTSATLKITVQAECQRVPGGFTGHLQPTGSFGILWIGPGNDDTTVNYTASTVTDASTSLKKFYNQYFSTGEMVFGNDSYLTKVYIVTVYRKPFETDFTIRAYTAARSGKFIFLGYSFDVCGGISGLPSNINGVIAALLSPICAIFNLFNIGFSLGDPMNVGFSWNLGDQLKKIINAPINAVLSIINELMAILLGRDQPFKGRIAFDVDVISSTFMSIDKADYMNHPAQKNFHPTATVPVSPTETINEHLYTQFIYPYVMKNPLYAFTDTFNYKEPYLNNVVIENTMYNDKLQIEHPLIKKYKYFVPSLFSLLYETNIGVFYEQLTKQLENKGIPRSYNIKTSQHEVPSEPTTPTLKQKECVNDLIFPTNLDKWNSKLEDTGWTNSGKADTSFLSNFVTSASVSFSGPGSGVPSEYASALGDYGISPSIAKAEEVIGNFAFIKGQVEACGSDLDAWTESCNLHCYELSTGSPKNLALKLAQFITWYLEPNGIADQTRMATRALIDFERIIDEEIDEYRAAAAGSNYNNFHIIGTEKYSRNCT